jgi:hypothetical protein
MVGPSDTLLDQPVKALGWNPMRESEHLRIKDLHACHSTRPSRTIAHLHLLLGACSLSLSGFSWHKTRKEKMARVSRNFASPWFCLVPGECESFIGNGWMGSLQIGRHRHVGRQPMYANGRRWVGLAKWSPIRCTEIYFSP